MDIKIDGAKEIEKCLKALPSALQHKIQQKAHEEAARPLVKRAQQLAPIDEGDLSESIGAIKPTLKKASEVGEIRVGPRRRRPYKGFAGHLIEFGTKPRKNKKGANRGLVKPTPFMAPAFNQTQTIVIGAIREETAKSLIKTMKRSLGKSFIK